MTGDLQRWAWLCVVTLGVVAWIWVVVRKRRREARWRALPAIGLEKRVVMVHGILGFDRVGRWGFEQHYFRGLWRFLEVLGVAVSYPRLPMTASVQVRALALADYVRSLEESSVILVAHSMGGLDARYAISKLGLADRVDALITVGTPHRGTCLADLSRGLLPRLFRWGLARLGLDTSAVDGLTRAATREFNATVRDVSSVRYFSVVASATLRTLFFNPALWLTFAYVRMVEGPNDGLVSAASQSWGTRLREIDADHWAQIGWTFRYDARSLYASVLKELAEIGV